MTEYLPAIFSLFGAVVGAVIGASLSYLFALKQFRSERWWEQKYQVYADILEALNAMRAELETSFDAHVINREIPEEEAAVLVTAYREGRKRIEKQRAIGGLVLGDKVVDELRKFERSMAKASGEANYFDHLDSSLAAVNECISTVITLGRDQLYAKR